MTHPHLNDTRQSPFSCYLTERQEDVVIEALRLLDFNGDRPDARELADALENDTWLCATAEPREG